MGWFLSFFTSLLSLRLDTFVRFIGFFVRSLLWIGSIALSFAYVIFSSLTELGRNGMGGSSEDGQGHSWLD